MQTTPAQRIKVTRDLLGITRENFSELVNIGYVRIATLENDRARMSVDDLAALDLVLPEFTDYLLHGKRLDVAQMEKSSNELVRYAAMRVRSGEIPEGYGLEGVIVNGSNKQ